MAEIISTKVQDLPVASSRENLEIPGFDTSTNAAAKLTAEQLVGGIGATPNITITAESIPNGETPTVLKTGDAENPNFLFGIPLAKDGANAPTPQTQYSADGSSWHSGYQTGDNYYRMSYDNGSTWSNAIPTNQGVIASGGIADYTSIVSISNMNLLMWFTSLQDSSNSDCVGGSVVEAPDTGSYFFKITKHDNGNGVITAVKYYGSNIGSMYTRTLQGGSWSDWVRVGEISDGVTMERVDIKDIHALALAQTPGTVEWYHGSQIVNAPTNGGYNICVSKDSALYMTLNAYTMGYMNSPLVAHYMQVYQAGTWSGWQKLVIENTDTEWHYEATQNGSFEIYYRKNKAGMVEMTLQCYNKNNNGSIRIPAGFVPPTIGDGSSGGTTTVYITLNSFSGSGEDKVVYEISSGEIYWYEFFGNGDDGFYQATYTYEPVA